MLFVNVICDEVVKRGNTQYMYESHLVRAVFKKNIININRASRKDVLHILTVSFAYSSTEGPTRINLHSNGERYQQDRIWL